MKQLSWFVLALVAAAGCEKKKAADPAAAGAPEAEKQEPAAPAAAPAPPPAPVTTIQYADTTSLWALAPAETTFGIVVADGVGPRALEIVNRARTRLEGKPFARKLNAQLDAWRKQQPFDLFDAAAYKNKGWDISKGLALFGEGADTSKPLLMVLPVTDLASFKATIDEAEATLEKVGEREVLKTKEALCVMASGRMVCGRSLEAIDAAVEPHDAPIVAAVKALGADARGDIEGYIDVAKTPAAAKELEDLRQVGEFSTAGGALRLDAAGVNLNLWAKGALSPLAAGFTAAAPPADFAAMTANATTVLRMRIDPKLMLMNAPPSLPQGEVDMRSDFLDQLTGDMQLVTAGKGLLAGALMMKVSDAARVKKALAVLCAEVTKGGQIPVSNVVQKEDSCAGEISLAKLKDAIGVELPPFKFSFSVPGQLFLVTLGDLDPAALKGSVVTEAASAEAKEALSGPQTVTLWTRGLGIDLGALPKPIVDKANADAEVADALALFEWSGGQIYELAATASIGQGVAKMNLHVTSMGADLPEARAAFDAALDKKLAGDRAGYTAALAEIESKFPTSLAARRAKLERIGTPVAGPISGLALGATAGFYMFMRAAGGGVQMPSTGGFGEPGATPPAEPAPEKNP
jgi:hypothetical protein